MESWCKHTTFPCWSFFHTRDYLKKINSNSFTILVKLPAVFTLNFCDIFSFVILHPFRQCYTNDILFVQTSHNIFLTFSVRGLELTQMIFLLFWNKLENDEIMISAFIANGNALREVVELLGHICFELHSVFDVVFFAMREVVEHLGRSVWTSLCFTLLYFSYMKYTPCSTWTSGCYHFELLSGLRGLF